MPSVQQHPSLRVVVVTARQLKPADRVLLQRMGRESGVELQAVIVDERASRRWADQLAAGRRRHGLLGILHEVATCTVAGMQRVGRALLELFHPPRPGQVTLQQLCQGLKTKLLRWSAASESLVRNMLEADRPDLVVLLTAPCPGSRQQPWTGLRSLQIHGSEAAQVETNIALRARSIATEADQEVTLAEVVLVPEECDTPESLSIKLEILGGELLLMCVREMALRPQACKPVQRLPIGFDSVPPMPGRDKSTQDSAKRVQARWTVWSRVRWHVDRFRVFVQFVLLLPFLSARRRWLVRQERAPIWMLFYHVVANRPLNHMAISLEQFAREVEFILRYHAIIPIEEAVARLRSEANKQIAVVLTFDDGYAANEWAIKYLRFYEIPACFFVSAGHVRDGAPFQHDLEEGWRGARPWSTEELSDVACDDGLIRIESHALFHEDFGRITTQEARDCLCESSDLLTELTGKRPRFFSFPFGQRDCNINAANYMVACDMFDAVFSAFGGYNLPGNSSRKHFLRLPNPTDMLELLCYLEGYTEFIPVLRGDAWSLRTQASLPFTSSHVESEDQQAIAESKVLSRVGTGDCYEQASR